MTKVKNILIISVLTAVALYSCRSRNNLSTEKVVNETASRSSNVKKSKSLLAPPDLKPYIYTDTTYTFSTGHAVTILNSFPKGGSIAPDGTQYVDPSGRKHAFASFWTQIINETNSPLEVSISSPADSLALFGPPQSYIKLFLPTQAWAKDKLSSFSYGLTRIQSFLDRDFSTGAHKQITIPPNEAHSFYVIVLSYEASGRPRAGLFLKENDLYYSMSIAPYGTGTALVGKFAFQE